MGTIKKDTAVFVSETHDYTNIYYRIILFDDGYICLCNGRKMTGARFLKQYERHKNNEKIVRDDFKKMSIEKVAQFKGYVLAEAI